MIELQFSLPGRVRALAALGALVALAGCKNDRSLSQPGLGYIASDVCAQHAAQTDCAAPATGCQWIALDSTASGATTKGGCVANDPCLLLGEAGCRADSGCAWSELASLCPLGASCTASNGFCHAKDSSGGDCVCVSPLACPADGTCAKVECDCSGGGTSGGSGGACSCACPACAPGQDCQPCACTCDGGGPNCTDPGTCACACPACASGETCPPCDCACSSNGSTTIGGTTTTTDPCSAYTDAASCTADTANSCAFYAFGRPCVVGEPCVTGVCQTTKPSTDPTCACACPPCPEGATCTPCTCDCGSGGTGGSMTGCVPPPTPDGPPPVACPAIGCFAPCPNGSVLDASGCPTCTCL